MMNTEIHKILGSKSHKVHQIIWLLEWTPYFIWNLMNFKRILWLKLVHITCVWFDTFFWNTFFYFFGFMDGCIFQYSLDMIIKFLDKDWEYVLWCFQMIQIYAFPEIKFEFFEISNAVTGIFFPVFFSLAYS